MKKYLCPICDQEMRGKHYCHSCHSWVKPVEFDQNFYLNERNPHQYGPEETKADWRENRPPEKMSGRKGAKRQKRGKGIVVASLGIAIFAAVMGVIAEYWEETEVRSQEVQTEEWILAPSLNQDILFEDGDDGAVSELFQERELTKEDMEEYKAAGEPCTFLTHFPVNRDAVEQALINTMDQEGREYFADESEYNSIIGQNEDTWFTHSTYFFSEDDAFWTDLSWDSVTEQVHNLYFSGTDKEFLKDMVRAAAMELLAEPDDETAEAIAEELDKFDAGAVDEESYYEIKTYENISVSVMMIDDAYTMEMYYYGENESI